MSEIEILKIENCLRDAQLGSDWKTLSELLSKRLTYIHSNGYIDNHESYLEKIQKGIIRYQKLELTPQTTHIFNELAIRTAIVRGTVLVLDNPKQLHNYTSTTWTKENSEWKLLLFQSTAIE